MLIIIRISALPFERRDIVCQLIRYLGVVDDVHLFDVGGVALDSGAGPAQVHQAGRGLVHLGAIIHATARQHLPGRSRQQDTTTAAGTGVGNHLLHIPGPKIRRCRSLSGKAASVPPPATRGYNEISGAGSNQSISVCIG